MHKRHRSQQQIRNRDLNTAFSLLETDEHFKQLTEDLFTCSPPTLCLDFANCPNGLHPLAGDLDQNRSERKFSQIRALAEAILPKLKPGMVCVEFGAGTGHLGLLIAFLRPDCKVILVEAKKWTSDCSKKRVDDLGFAHVEVFCGTLAEFEESQTPFSLAISLHSCGLLTDMIQELCLKRSVPYVLCPCCYGQITKRDSNWRSLKLREKMPSSDFSLIASASDFTVPADDTNFPNNPSFHIAKKGMIAIDYDRSMLAEQNGFVTQMLSLSPLNCSPKNNVIIGVPKEQKELPKFIHLDCDRYDELLQSKIANVRSMFSESVSGEVFDSLCVCASPPRHFRLRCRFQLIQTNEEIDYVMWDDGCPSVKIQSFPIASEIIFRIMPVLKKQLQGHPLMSDKIQAVNFLSTLYGDCLIVLIYQNKVFDDEWDIKASAVRNGIVNELFPDGLPVENVLGIIGRSKKQVRRIACSHIVNEVLSLSDGRKLRYQQVEGSFSNPNGIVNQRALDWICSIAQEIAKHNHQFGQPNNLLELYCGNGNHTVGLAKYFENIVCVELDQKLCSVANVNLKLNGIENVTVVGLASEKFCQIFLGKKEFTREKDGNLSTFGFQSVLVDPPRVGLDSITLKLVAGYDNIIYISCNPKAFLANFRELSKTHRIPRMAVFDQFAYTDHLECGFWLSRI